MKTTETKRNYQKEYRKANADKVREYQRMYRQQNTIKIKEYMKVWRAKQKKCDLAMSRLLYLHANRELTLEKANEILAGCLA